MISQTFYPTKYIVKRGANRDIFPLIGAETNKLFVITGHRSMQDAGVIAGLEKQCAAADVDLLVRSGINTNPTHLEIDSIADECKKYGADTIIGLGGGSSVDAAKIVAMLCSNPGSSWDYISITGRPAQKIQERKIKLVAIPTTSGAGSEATPYAVITHSDTRMKKGMGSPFLYPDVAIIDAELLALMPQKQVAVTGLDAFGQALEGFTSGKHTLHSDFYGLSALRQIVTHIRTTFDDPFDLDAKEGMAWGASLAGLSIGLVDVNLAHAMSHPLSGRFNIQHGLAVALCTAPAIWFNRNAVGDKYRTVAELMGRPGLSGDSAAIAVIDFFKEMTTHLNIDLKLRNYGVPKDALNLLAEEAMEIGAIRTNAVEVNLSDVKRLFNLVWEGAYV